VGYDEVVKDCPIVVFCVSEDIFNARASRGEVPWLVFMQLKSSPENQHMGVTEVYRDFSQLSSGKYRDKQIKISYFYTSSNSSSSSIF
jgi:hypothetical protein